MHQLHEFTMPLTFPYISHPPLLPNTDFCSSTIPTSHFAQSMLSNLPHVMDENLSTSHKNKQNRTVSLSTLFLPPGYAVRLLPTLDQHQELHSPRNCNFLFLCPWRARKGFGSLVSYTDQIYSIKTKTAMRCDGVPRRWGSRSDS